MGKYKGVCVIGIVSCLAGFTLASTTGSTAASPTVSISSYSNTQSTKATATTVSSSTQSKITTSTGSTVSPSSVSTNASSSTQEATETSTSPTTSPSTRSTTAAPVLCKNGTCSGNDSSCLNETIPDTCVIKESESCYVVNTQITFSNGTYTNFEVGCKSNCENLEEKGNGGTGVTRKTRCCNTNLCNNELLPDPDPKSSAINISMQFLLVLLLLIVGKMFT